jgi:outer membrane phospholipase A
MLGETIMGLSALKSALDLSKGLKDISDATIRNSAVIELQQKILDAQAAQFELVQRIDQLEKEKAALENVQAKMGRYRLVDYGAGSFAYELKPDAADGEPLHRACAKCYQSGQLSILQFSHHSSGQDWYDCHQCGKNQHFGRYTQRSDGYGNDIIDY